MRTRSQGYADQAAVRLEGRIGAETGVNSLRCTALFHLTGGKTYTLYVSAGQDCPPFSAYVGDENTYLGLQTQGKSVVARHPNQCVYSRFVTIRNCARAGSRPRGACIELVDMNDYFP